MSNLNSPSGSWPSRRPQDESPSPQPWFDSDPATEPIKVVPPVDSSDMPTGDVNSASALQELDMQHFKDGTYRPRRRS